MEVGEGRGHPAAERRLGEMRGVGKGAFDMDMPFDETGREELAADIDHPRFEGAGLPGYPGDEAALDPYVACEHFPGEDIEVPASPENQVGRLYSESRPTRRETLAVIGHTGAGKTTIVNLLLRFYDPQRGRITIDGVDIRELSVAELRSLVGYVQQDIFLFADDVATNIRLSAPLPDEAVEAAAKRVGADRIIARLPGGYGHRLAERGASVSVGERQLLSFARAVAADPALLVLDEATSAVDSRIEADIQRALRELMAGRTTIAIAHRLSTIVSSTEILVMHHGEVRERGTHEGLLAVRGLYSRLYRLEGAVSGDPKRVATPVGGG